MFHEILPQTKNEPIVHNSTLITRTSTSTVYTVGILPSSSQQKGTHNSQQHLVNKHSSKCGILGSRL
jgi:xanthine dehydrogenase iron-sulfur cluster and FAD-binding subunit A